MAGVGWTSIASAEPSGVGDIPRGVAWREIRALGPLEESVHETAAANAANRGMSFFSIGGFPFDERLRETSQLDQVARKRD